jgi:mannose/cellobiose epimerase-like protein (N-acyl-D-glucosamine 2-epimerase family)
MKKILLFTILALSAITVSCTMTAPEGKPEYEWRNPGTQTVPAELQGNYWRDYYTSYIKPFWTTSDAKGTPQGNFPTTYNRNGTANKSTAADEVRYTRMLGRQIYTYAMGYLLTGDEELAQLAKDGVDWLELYARDIVNGGWHPRLDPLGNPTGTGDDLIKTAQDMSYVAMGPAAYYFITRDETAEQQVLDTRELIMVDFWDSDNDRIWDGMDTALTTGSNSHVWNGWDLVSALDQINAYMTLVQPVLSNSQDQNQFLADMETICDMMLENCYQDGIFWGTSTSKGNFGEPHCDNGHSLKAYWMLFQTDKRLAQPKYWNLALKNMKYWINLAWHNDNEQWSEAYTSYKSTAGGAVSWWVYAECQQIAMTADLLTGWFENTLEISTPKWINLRDNESNNYGHMSTVSAGGSRYGAKGFYWKNGFHETEHALIAYIYGRYLENEDVELYFAVPAADVDTFIARPYIFNGIETGRTIIEDITIDGEPLKKVRVSFSQIW